MSEDEQLGPDEKNIPKKEAIAMLGVSLRTFFRMKKDLKEQFGMEPEMLWDPNNNRLASLYSLTDIRKMMEIKHYRQNWRERLWGDPDV